ncbi:DUF1697 domain-containing protein [Streptantibioticus ferralitis]|uniref:DUF1697 domain-containing protein n=1 Tax=Streptantibioticus ferralitis TaxID=236510 RepID=A0ABT5Z4K8_9ACTN|nr:DUF1697 domain-containing protein [Streptantibioticus ferralitis]MDF2258761.1 DUF1697 domain-containing protein [Streptantibioticus ferralitis]
MALLRGINLGSRNRLAMRTLRELIAAMGGKDVKTLLQSGNAVFEHVEADPARLAGELESRIAEETGLTVPCVIRTGADIQRVVERNPFAKELSGAIAGVPVDPARLVVTFLSGPLDASKLSEPDPERYAPDQFRQGESELYVHCPNGISDSRLVRDLTTARLGVTGTARNWNTVTKLAALTSD